MRRFHFLAALALALPGYCIALAESPCAEELPPANSFIIEMPLPAYRVSSADPANEMARLRYHLYRRYEYPLRLSELDAEIRLAEAELRSLDGQINEYESISRPYTSHPFLVTLESARLRRLGTQLRLKNLRKEKLLTLQNFQSERRLRKLEIEAGMP